MEDLSSVDFSYMQYPNGSYGKVLGRRREANKLAVKVMERDNVQPELHRRYYENAYFFITMNEYKSKYATNNWRRFHNLPMIRRYQYV